MARSNLTNAKSRTSESGTSGLNTAMRFAVFMTAVVVTWSLATSSAFPTVTQRGSGLGSGAPGSWSAALRPLRPAASSSPDVESEPRDEDTSADDEADDGSLNTDDDDDSQFTLPTASSASADTDDTVSRAADDAFESGGPGLDSLSDGSGDDGEDADRATPGERRPWDHRPARINALLAADDARAPLTSAPGDDGSGALAPAAPTDAARFRAAAEAMSPRLNWAALSAGAGASDVVMLGDVQVMRRDRKPALAAYTSLGLKVVSAWDWNAKRGLAAGHMRSVRGHEWAVFLCFAFQTSQCLQESEYVELDAQGEQHGRFLRINYLAGLQSVLWSKAAFCTSTQSSGAWLSAFSFPCWVLPRDTPALKRFLGTAITTNSDSNSSSTAAPRGGEKWIVKPYKQGGGMGIFVVDSDRELARVATARRGKPYVVQPYLAAPHLLNGCKWDMRTYVLATAVTPFARGYLYHDGLVRIATTPYDADAKRGGKRTQFLTNTSVNKRKQKDYSQLTWSFARLKEELGDDAFDLLFSRMRRAVGMLLVTAEARFRARYDLIRPGFTCSSCYHLMGVDLIVDAQLFPRVIELNGEPSMFLSGAADSHYDTLKTGMAAEVARIVAKPTSALAVDATQTLSALRLPAGDVAALARDEHAVAYLLQLRREHSQARGFHRVYPDIDSCSNGGRARVWDDFLATVQTNNARAAAAERRKVDPPARRLRLHRAARALACALQREQRETS